MLAEFLTRAPARDAVEFAAARHTLLESGRRNAEIVQALGMGGAMSTRFGTVNENYLR